MAATGTPPTFPITRQPAWPSMVERGKPGILSVGNSRGAGELFRESAQAGPKHERHFRAQICFCENEFRGALGAGELVFSTGSAWVVFPRFGLIAS